MKSRTEFHNLGAVLLNAVVGCFVLWLAFNAGKEGGVTRPFWTLARRPAEAYSSPSYSRWVTWGILHGGRRDAGPVQALAEFSERWPPAIRVRAQRSIRTTNWATLRENLNRAVAKVSKHEQPGRQRRAAAQHYGMLSVINQVARGDLSQRAR